MNVIMHKSNGSEVIVVVPPEAFEPALRAGVLEQRPTGGVPAPIPNAGGEFVPLPPGSEYFYAGTEAEFRAAFPWADPVIPSVNPPAPPMGSGYKTDRQLLEEIHRMVSALMPVAVRVNYPLTAEELQGRLVPGQMIRVGRQSGEREPLPPPAPAPDPNPNPPTPVPERGILSRIFGGSR